MVTKTLEAAHVGLPMFDFERVDDPDIFSLSSHQRAKTALALGLARPGPQYNIYVVGPQQAGRMTATRHYIEAWASDQPACDDWVYLLDFNHPGSPRPVSLPAGTGAALRDAVDAMLPAIASEVASAFGSEAYQQRVTRLKSSVEGDIQERSKALEARAHEKGLALVNTPQGPGLAAIGEDGEPVPLGTLPPAERERLTGEGEAIMAGLSEIGRDAVRMQQDYASKLRSLDAEVARLASAGHIEGTAAQFADHEVLAAWFKELGEDVLRHMELFFDPKEASPTADPERAIRRYGVNLLVDRRNDQHRAVVLEQNPSYENLFGKIEYRQLPGGGLETDVSLIKAGSLHRANGGVLLLRAADLISQGGVWSFLKAALRDGEIRIEEFYRAGAPPIAGAPRPVPIPLDLTVVVIGSPSLYQLFFATDPEFSNYFKIKANIEPLIDATPDNLGIYAGLLRTYARSRGADIDDDALRLLLGTAARWAGQRKRISAQFEELTNLIEESCDGCELIDAASIRAASRARRQRNSHIEDEVHRAIRDELTIITVTGEAVGQVNGLTVQNVGDHTFGTPARITARASIGRRGVINIERLVAMSGPIQQKGTLTLQGLLTRRFARHVPPSFDCSVTFEQLYGGVEGDSASLAEFIAIVSDLADLPVRQDLAITGSVNQIGEAQVIGGIHHKVEGFYRACEDAGGLSGNQGVVLPAGNEQHLVLRDPVAEAIEAGQFHLYSVENVDDAVELFLGMPVGSAAAPGDDTVYGRVVKTLNEFDEILAKRGL